MSIKSIFNIISLSISSMALGAVLVLWANEVNDTVTITALVAVSVGSYIVCDVFGKYLTKRSKRARTLKHIKIRLFHFTFEALKEFFDELSDVPQGYVDTLSESINALKKEEDMDTITSNLRLWLAKNNGVWIETLDKATTRLEVTIQTAKVAMGIIPTPPEEMVDCHNPGCSGGNTAPGWKRCMVCGGLGKVSKQLNTLEE